MGSSMMQPSLTSRSTQPRYRQSGSLPTGRPHQGRIRPALGVENRLQALGSFVGIAFVHPLDHGLIGDLGEHALWHLVDDVRRDLAATIGRLDAVDERAVDSGRLE